MKWRRVIPFSFTVAALVAGLFSILKSAAGDYVAAAQFIMLSMILDGLDGVSARLLKSSSHFGAELDTFVDITSFGVAPAVLAYQAVFHDFGAWGAVMVSFMLTSGAMRLARFRVVDPYRGQRGYLGLPITTNAGWVALFMLIWQSGFGAEETFSLVRGPVAAFVWTCSVIMLFLQVSHVRYSKPTKEPGLFVPSFVLILLVFTRGHLAPLSALTLCVFGFFYAFITPFLPKHGLEEDADEEEPVPLHRP
ncbi:MAG: CDP-alcohol phosphatidyltransferase family protein [Kiritimatiellae bacterium]|nr:CDP-alcohol phosphatidyltransferase family protein [Kiritimatiellia bacterium]